MAKKHWRVLMVDDDEEEYIITKEILSGDRNNQFRIIWVSTVEAALGEIENDQYDAVLVDYDLGKNTGLELLQEIHSKGLHIPLIIHTGRPIEFFEDNQIPSIYCDIISKNDVTAPLLEQSIRYAVERKKIEEELRKAGAELEVRVQERTRELVEANELFETVFSSINIHIAYLDPKFNFIRVNENYARKDERDVSDYPGKNHFDLYPNPENKAIFQKVVDTGEPFFAYEKAFEYADHLERGTTYWDWSLRPVKGDDKEVIGLVLALVDVTGHVRAEQAKFATESRLIKIADHLPIAFWAIDKNGIFTLCRGKLMEVIGLDAGCLVGKHYTKVLANHPETLELVRKAFKGEEACEISESLGDRAQKVERRFFPEYNERGEIIGVVGLSVLVE
ncbi:MAG: response regulator [Chloroflexi bacterium]|nr:MAG: response regulator [Chloroflexota bacterium]